MSTKKSFSTSDDPNLRITCDTKDFEIEIIKGSEIELSNGRKILVENSDSNSNVDKLCIHDVKTGGIVIVGVDELNI